MFGSGMFSAMQRAKGASHKKQTPEELLEESRKKHAAAASADREKLKAQKATRDRVAAATKQALAEERARVDAEDAAEARAVAEYRDLVARRDPRVARDWFYLDDGGARQGPFSPAQMRTWFADGHLPESLRVMAAFDDGKVPDAKAAAPIAAVFAAPLLTTAFRSTPKPALRKKAPPKKTKRKRDEPPPETGNWLRDSLARQKRGIHRLRHDRHDGPGMIYESHEA